MITSLLRPLAKAKPATRLLTARRMFSEQPNPVTVFTDDEQMIRDAVRAWAREELKPVVREMDNEAKLRPEILQALFQQGLMGMEIPESKTLLLFS